MAKDKRRLTVSRPELLDEEGDGRFRTLLADLFAFGSRLDDARARFAAYIGLTPPQYLILIVVSLAPPDSEVGVAQVAERLYLSGAFVTIEVNKLVKIGLIEKQPHSSDRRRVHLVVTPEGIRRLERLAGLQRPVNDALFSTLDRADFDRLSDALHRLAHGAAQAIHLADHLIASEEVASSR